MTRCSAASIAQDTIGRLTQNRDVDL